jgi:hypothetical protein
MSELDNVTVLVTCPECGRPSGGPIKGEVVELPEIVGHFMTRDGIIAKLAGAFGRHLAPVPRDTGDPRWDKGRFDYEPDGNDEQGSTMLVFRGADGQNSMRPLTYGEIADVLAPPSNPSP